VASFSSKKFSAVWAWFEDEFMFAKYHNRNPLATTILAELAIHIDRGSPTNLP